MTLTEKCFVENTKLQQPYSSRLQKLSSMIVATVLKLDLHDTRGITPKRN